MLWWRESPVPAKSELLSSRVNNSVEKNSNKGQLFDTNRNGWIVNDVGHSFTLEVVIISRDYFSSPGHKMPEDAIRSSQFLFEQQLYS